MMGSRRLSSKCGRNRCKCFFWPCRKPINDGIIYQTREIPTPRTQQVSSRGHAQHNMQVLTRTRNKETPKLFLKITYVFFESIISDPDRMTLCFSSSGYSAGTAPLVKILLMSSRKLSLATWLSVNKNTTFSLSTPTLLNKRFQILPKRVLVVSTCQSDLEN